MAKKWLDSIEKQKKKKQYRRMDGQTDSQRQKIIDSYRLGAEINITVVKEMTFLLYHSQWRSQRGRVGDRGPGPPPKPHQNFCPLQLPGKLKQQPQHT